MTGTLCIHRQSRYSQAGTAVFPVWEHSIPIVGIFKQIWINDFRCAWRFLIKTRGFSKKASSLPSIARNAFKQRKVAISSLPWSLPSSLPYPSLHPSLDFPCAYIIYIRCKRLDENLSNFSIIDALKFAGLNIFLSLCAWKARCEKRAILLQMTPVRSRIRLLILL